LNVELQASAPDGQERWAEPARSRLQAGNGFFWRLDKARLSCLNLNTP